MGSGLGGRRLSRVGAGSARWLHPHVDRGADCRDGAGTLLRRSRPCSARRGRRDAFEVFTPLTPWEREPQRPFSNRIRKRIRSLQVASSPRRACREKDRMRDKPRCAGSRRGAAIFSRIFTRFCLRPLCKARRPPRLPMTGRRSSRKTSHNEPLLVRGPGHAPVPRS